MATIKKEDHDGFIGNAGPLRVTKWKDKVVVKTRQSGPTGQKSEKQEQASRRFGLLTRFAGVAKAYLSAGYKGDGRGNGQHSFISGNMHDGVTGDWPEYRLDYGKLRLSEGRLQKPEETRASVEQNTIRIEWNPDNIGDGNDLLAAMIYNEEKEEAAIDISAARRKDGRVETAVPKGWGKGSKMHVYVCFTDERESSETVYVGMLKSEGGRRSGEGWKVYEANKKKRTRRKKDETEKEVTEEDARHVEAARGKVGGVIAYKRDGETYIRSRYKTTKPPTEAKRMQNEKFGMMTRFVRCLNDFVKAGLKGYAGSMSQMNAAIKLNYRDGFETDEGKTRLKFEAIRLSEGKPRKPEALTVELEGRLLRLRWETSEGDRNDVLMVAVYDAENERGHTELNAGRRDDREAVVELTDKWSGCKKAHVYAAFATADGEEAGDSVYVCVERQVK